MLYRDENKVVLAFADDLADVERFISTRPRLWPSRNSETSPARGSWDMSAGYDGALRLAKEGWSEGARNMHAGLSAKPLDSDERLPTVTYDVMGEYPDVGRYLSGDPLCMRRHGRRQHAKPTVHIMLNIVSSAIVSAQAYANYGLAMVALIDKLEDSGRRVELDVLMVNSHNGRGRSVIGWKVKRAEDALDLAAVAYSIAHPAAFRRLGFAIWEHCPSRLHSPGYGSCGSLTRADAAALDSETAFLVDGVGREYSRCCTVEDALALAQEQLNKAAREELIEVGHG